ncbi:uncharacterized protein LOC119606761 [Lucilia sericata]|uniref:uncharacterized protein LOC119606761 n=1 Tax=Lucilia sericata TaxID=13632 RepID=UPI0018A7E9A1|nr:uncharacterized protein LOC119606761 [Lucilia sericata]
MKGNNPATLQAFKKQRGNWVSTVYNLGRPDACKHIFDHSEIWASVLDVIPEEDRKCPFYKGQKLHFEVVADMSVYVPDPHGAGEYMLQLKVEVKEHNETFCTNLFADFYRA